MITSKWLLTGAILFGTLTLGGCSQKPAYDVKPQDSLEQARKILNDYAKGVAPGSEQMTFADIVEDVRKTDAGKAQTLERGFAAISRNPRSAASQARALLKQI
jgi:hypothetical protein